MSRRAGNHVTAQSAAAKTRIPTRPKVSASADRPSPCGSARSCICSTRFRASGGVLGHVVHVATLEVVLDEASRSMEAVRTRLGSPRQAARATALRGSRRDHACPRALDATVAVTWKGRRERARDTMSATWRKASLPSRMLMGPTWRATHPHSAQRSTRPAQLSSRTMKRHVTAALHGSRERRGRRWGIGPQARPGPRRAPSAAETASRAAVPRDRVGLGTRGGGSGSSSPTIMRTDLSRKAPTHLHVCERTAQRPP